MSGENKRKQHKRVQYKSCLNSERFDMNAAALRNSFRRLGYRHTKPYLSIWCILQYTRVIKPV